MNLPNSITMTRIMMIPLFLWILSPHFSWAGPSGTQEVLASILFVLASITDGLRQARRVGSIGPESSAGDALAYAASRRSTSATDTNRRAVKSHKTCFSDEGISNSPTRLTLENKCSYCL